MSRGIPSWTTSTRPAYTKEPYSNSRVCLVIPYFNAGDDLPRTLASVRLRREDLIVVVDDGSSEKPGRQYCPHMVGETRVLLVELPENGGITGALKRGLLETPPEYDLIARLDCGDLCTPDRFQQQRQFLETHPQHALVGSWVEFVSPSGSSLYTLKLPTDEKAVANYMRINSAFIHPAVTFRRRAYYEAGGYSEKYPAAEDYGLFRSICRDHKATNLDAIHMYCRTGDGGISQRRRRTQLISRMKIMVEHFDYHPLTLWGIMRACLQLITPRSLTTRLRGMASRRPPGVPDSDL